VRSEILHAEPFEIIPARQLYPAGKKAVGSVLDQVQLAKPLDIASNDRRHAKTPQHQWHR
jgi:hypothetical protein